MQVTQTQVDRLAEAAREQGRLGLDTEFMPEGRYRPLLCLVQIVVGEHVEVLDPLVDSFDPTPLAEVLADPAIEIVLHAGRQDVAILRREWQHDVHQRLRHPGRGGLRRLLGPGRLQRPAARRAADPAAEDGELHALGRAPADRGADPLRARRRRAPAAAGRRHPAPPGRARAAGVGARGVRGDRRGHRRARPRRGLAPAAARERAGPARARRRPGARRAGASAPPRTRTGPSARSCATRPSSSSPSASPPGGASWRRSAASRPTWCAAAATT